MNHKVMKDNRKIYKLELVLRDDKQEMVFDITVSYDAPEKEEKDNLTKEKIE